MLVFQAQAEAAGPKFDQILTEMKSLTPAGAEAARGRLILSGLDWDYRGGAAPKVQSGAGIESLIGPLPEGWSWSEKPPENRYCRAALSVVSKDGDAAAAPSGGGWVLMSGRDAHSWLLLDFAAPNLSLSGAATQVQERLTQGGARRTNQVLWAPMTDIWVPPILSSSRVFQVGVTNLLWGASERRPLISFVGVPSAALSLESAELRPEFKGGIWSLRIVPKLPVMEPFSIEFRDAHDEPPSLVLTNLLAGNVWLVAGDTSIIRFGTNAAPVENATPQRRILAPAIQVSSTVETNLFPLGQRWSSALPGNWLGNFVRAGEGTEPEGFIVVSAGGAGFEPWMPIAAGVHRQGVRRLLTKEQWVTREDLLPILRKVGLDGHAYSEGEIYYGTLHPIFRNPVGTDLWSCPLAGALWVHGAWQASQDQHIRTLRGRYASSLESWLKFLKINLGAPSVAVAQLPGSPDESNGSESEVDAWFQVQLSQLAALKSGDTVVPFDPVDPGWTRRALTAGPDWFDIPTNTRVRGNPAAVILHFNGCFPVSGIGRFLLELQFTNSASKRRSHTALVSLHLPTETNRVRLELPAGLSDVNRVVHLGGLKSVNGRPVPVFEAEPH